MCIVGSISCSFIRDDARIDDGGFLCFSQMHTFPFKVVLNIHFRLIAAIICGWSIEFAYAQLWNDLGVGAVGHFPRRENPRDHVAPQQIDSSYDIIDTVRGAQGPPARNCTGSGCCIPKCFAEKGARGFPGLTGLQVISYIY